MIDITIPPEAVEAARIALEKCNGGQQFYLNEVEPAIRAALSAWPGMHHYIPNAEPYYGKHIILPLTKENSNG